MEGHTELQIAHCSACRCKMDISSLGPYTNVVCPDCGQHSRVKCELDHYLLTHRYAVGGMSMVFAAQDTTLQREVAIKVLNEEYSGDAVRMEQFQHEAQITAALSHPHIVRVFTVGKAYGVYYIAMEMVPGKNLEQRMASEGAIKEDEVLAMAAEMIAGLRAARNAGLIHRDVKPGNILFDAGGHVKIVDFGLALITQGGTAKADEIWATPYYVPPEALDGLEEDFRSDIYALGATLYHALSAKSPISEEVKSTREVRKAKESVLPLATVAPWLKPETCYLIDKAMALRPDERFSSYQEMGTAWEAAYHAVQEDGVSEPIHGQERARRRGGPNRYLLGLFITVPVILAAVAAAVLMYLNKTEETTDQVATFAGAPSEADQGVNSLTVNDEAYSPEVAAKIGRMFRDSHALLKNRKYDEAREVFVQLMNDPQVKEPAASWAGVEAVIATWLGGNSEDARASISRLEKHMNKRQFSSSGDMRVLVDLLSAPGVIRDTKVSKGSMAMVHLMAVALKNWEIGAWDAAVPVLNQVEAADIPASNPLHVYRLLSKRYLADYKLLKPFADQSAPTTLKEARTRSEQLKSALQKLQTRGRARFHIRVWQIRSLYQIRELRQKEVKAGIENSKAPGYSQVLPEFRELLNKALYAEAAELLQDVTIESDQEAERDAWVYLTDSASEFLGSLEDIISENEVALEIEDRDKKIYRKIISSQSGGLNVQSSEGVVLLRWASISPGSVLDIHKKVFKQTLQTLEGQLRTERALCYAWLVAEYDQATRAADMLAAQNEGFRKRWDKTMGAIKQDP